MLPKLPNRPHRQSVSNSHPGWVLAALALIGVLAVVALIAGLVLMDEGGRSAAGC